MASSGNFTTINPLQKISTGTFSNGNLTYALSGTDGFIVTQPMTTKTYCEVRIDAQSNYGGSVGLRSGDGQGAFSDSVTFQTNYSSGAMYYLKGTSEQTSPGNIGGVVATGAVVMMAYDPATFKWWVGVNGTWRNSGDPANGTGFIYQGSATQFDVGTDVFWGGGKGSANGMTVTWNFGQDDTFGGQETAAGNADGNGFGVFKYSPPTGFFANTTANIVISDDIDPAQTDDDIPTKQFGVVTYTGNGGASLSVTGLGFKPDLCWLKQSSTGEAYSNNLIDSTRGRSKTLYSSRADAEATSASDKDFGTFDSDGFTVLDDYNTNMNQSSITNVAWCWRANGGVTSSNSDGDITSTVQANTKAGFSIVTYTGNGSVAQSIGHGLSSGAPELIFVKNRDAGDDWAVYHHSLGNSGHLLLNSTAPATTGSAYWGSFTPTTSLFKVGSDHKLNANSEKYVAYLWHGVEGYSKFGKYFANSSTTSPSAGYSGPTIYTGFRPRLIFIKMGAVESDSWYVWDSSRNTYNVMTDALRWDKANTTITGSAYHIDFLSNGFKIRTSEASINSTVYDPYYWGAWGDVPFKYNNTF